MSSCPLCERSFENSLSNEFVIHVNACLDSQEQKLMPKNFYVQDETRLHPLMRKKKEREQANNCVVCGKVKATAAHIKKCGKKNGINTSQLIKLVDNNQSNVNSNLENIVLKDSNLNQSQIVNNFFTDNENIKLKSSPIQNENQLQQNSSDQNNLVIYKSSNNYPGLNFIPVDKLSLTDHKSSIDTNCTFVLDKKTDDFTVKNQTKLKIIHKSKKKIDKLPDGFSEDAPVHLVKRKKTIKLKRKPLVNSDPGELILQNFKDENICERELPKSWKLATLNFSSEMYTIDDFKEFCKCFDFKKEMNGFEIGNEIK